MRYKIVITLLLLSIFTHPFLSSSAESAKTRSDKNIMLDSEIINFMKSFSAAYKKGDVEEYMTFFSSAAFENGSIPVDKGEGNALLTSGNVRIRFIKEDKKIRIAAIDYDKHISGDYVIGNEDVLDISVWKSPELSLSIMVRPDGMISLPLIGEVRADGRTPKELKKEIEESLREYRQEPIVSIIVKESNSKSIYITGEITRPGKYPLRSETTITQAIALAGGFTQWANKDKILLIRKSPMNPEGNRVTIKYSDIVSGTNMKANILLKAGDTVIVP